MSAATAGLRCRLGRAYTAHRPVRWLSKLTPLLVVALAWQLASGRVVTAAVLPPFTAAAAEAVALPADPRFARFAGDTLLRGFAGVLVAVVVAVPTGLAMARNDRVRAALDPVVSLTYPVPKSPLIPIVIFWLGAGNLSRIVLAVIGSVLPILLSAFNGAREVDRELVWSARSMGVSGFDEVARVVLPAALPTVLTGVRIGLIFSFIIIVSSEMIMAQTGLGVLVVEFGQFGEYAKVFGVVIWIAGLVAGLDRLYLLVTGRLLAWSEEGVGGV